MFARKTRQNSQPMKNRRFERLEQRTVLSAAGWTTTATGLEGAGSNDVETDAAGNIYLTGAFEGTADFAPGANIPGDTLTSTGAYDMFAAKYAPDGSFVWAEAIGAHGIGKSVAVDTGGNSFLGGSQAVVKLDSNGSVMWLQSITGATNFVEGVATSGSDVVAVGYSYDTITVGQDTSGNSVSLSGGGAFMVKYNSDGDVLWAQQKSSAAEAASVAVDSNGDVYVTGTLFEAGTGKGKKKVPGTNDYDAVVWKLDGSDGDFIWTKYGGADSRDEGLSVYVDGSGGVYMTGEIGFETADATADFGSTSITVPGSLSKYGFVTKLDAATGDFQWATGFGHSTNYVNGQVGRSLSMDSSGTLHLGGYVSPDGGQFGSFALGTTADTSHNFMATLDSSTGQFESAERVAGEGWDFLTVDSNDNVVLSGWFRGENMEFPTGDILSSTPDVNGDPSDDLFLVKLLADDPSVDDPPIADAGSDQSAEDSDGNGIQSVTLDGTSSSDDGTIVSYEWFENSTLIATGATPQLDFAVGTHIVSLVVTDDGGQSDSDTVIVEVVDAPVGVEFAIYDIRFDSKRGGKDWRAVVEIRDAEGNAVEEVSLKVDFAGTTYNLTTDSNGIARTDWHRNLASGSYLADAYDLALTGYFWDPFSQLNEETDSDGDGHPDDVLTV